MLLYFTLKSVYFGFLVADGKTFKLILLAQADFAVSKEDIGNLKSDM